MGWGLAIGSCGQLGGLGTGKGGGDREELDREDWTKGRVWDREGWAMLRGGIGRGRIERGGIGRVGQRG